MLNVVAAGQINDRVQPFHVYLDDASTLKFREVRRPQTGVFDFTYERPTAGTFVFVTSTGIAGTNIHTDAFPLVRTITDHGFTVSMINLAEGGGGFVAANASFRFLVVQGLGIGIDSPGKEGPL